jgi:hypothetical protein
MTFDDLINNITPEIHQQLIRAIELGKWANGNKLTSEQREASMQAVIAYELEHVPPEHRVGYMEQGCKSKA